MRESKSIHLVLEKFIQKNHLYERQKFAGAVEVYNNKLRHSFLILQKTYAKNCTNGTLWILNEESYQNFEILTLKTKMMNFINQELEQNIVNNIKITYPQTGEIYGE